MLSPEQLSQISKRTGIQPAAPSTAPDLSALDAAWGTADIKKQTDISTHADQATFPATGDESPGVIAAKTVGNIPKSAYNFGKSTLEFLNPLNTVKKAKEIGTSVAAGLDEGTSVKDLAVGTIKELPKTAYDSLVPQFLHHIFSGDLQKAAATLENDPVGQIAPLLMVARGVAEKAGRGAEFDSAMSTIASPVTKAASKVKEGAGNAASQVLGASTGSGGSSIKEAFKSASEGPEKLDAFTKAMRGETTPEDVISSAQNVVKSIKENRHSSYVEQLKTVGEDKSSHDITPVTDTLTKQLDNFGVKQTKDGLDFSRSSIANNGTARSDIQGVYDTVKSWGTKPGDRTGLGLDLLKKQLDDFYSPSSQARAFVQSVKSQVVNILNTKVKGYKDMTSGYAKTSKLLEEIKSATGVGSNAKPDTVFTKLTTAMKGDKDFRLEILKEMEKTDPALMNKIAGTNLNSWMPKGIVGKGADVAAIMSTLAHAFNPQMIPFILSTSPRIMGEFVRGLGMAADKTTKVLDAINNIPESIKVPLKKELMDKLNSKVSVGLSVKSVGSSPAEVAKKLNGKDVSIVQNYVNTPTLDNLMKLQPLLEPMGIGSLNIDMLQRFFTEVIQERNKSEDGIITGTEKKKTVKAPKSSRK